ncbi:MAG: glycosyltransferase [Lachnospiraceae bacterium]|nr:glycosyltransferase [Lachnospiraceae bacterium]
MKAAIITNWARIRSIGKIAWGLREQLIGNGDSVKLFYGRKDPSAENIDGVIRFCSDADIKFNGVCARVFGAEGFYSKGPTKQLIKALDDFKPDVIYLVILHGYYLNFPMLFDYMGKNNIKVIYLMLDEYAFLGKCPYSFECNMFQTECNKCPQIKEYPKSIFFDRSKDIFYAKKEAYGKIKDLTFVGIEYTVQQAKLSALMKDAKYAVMDEAVDLRNIYFPRNTAGLREKLGIPKNAKIVVTVAPFSNPRKGCRYYLESARKLEYRKDIYFVHVGFDGDKDICPSNYIPISYVSNQDELAEYYSLADLFVCTSLAETIPASCLEALSCGSPLLGFMISGMPTCSDAEHGAFVEACNVEAMVNVLKDIKQKDQKVIDSCRKYAESRYDAIEYRKKLVALAKRKCEE